MLGSLDPAKILVILVIALVVLGPERLPRAARQLGAAWRELTRLRDQVSEEVRSALPDVDLPRIPQGAVSGFLRDLTAPAARSAEPGSDETGGAAGEGGAAPADVAAYQLPPETPPRYADRPEEYAGAERAAAPARSIGPPAAVPSFAPDDPGMN